MIITSLIDADSATPLGRAYLADTPFPGDTVATRTAVYTVIRRRFLDLGPDSAVEGRLAAELTVRVLS